MSNIFDFADIELSEDGPILLRGDHQVKDADGNIHKTWRPVTALCRCGKSSRKPWCDGTHKLAAASRRSSTEQPASTPPTEHMRLGGLQIRFDHRVLRPRAWTSEQAQWIVETSRVAPDGPILELCCGVGHIGLLAVQKVDRNLVAVDIDPTACEFAALNHAAAGLDHRSEIRCGDIHQKVKPSERFPLVIADPPWVPTGRMEDHPADPSIAIDGGADGTKMVWRCLDVIREHMTPGGYAILQLRDLSQAARVRQWADAPANAVQACGVRERVGGVLMRLRHQPPLP